MIQLLTGLVRAQYISDSPSWTETFSDNESVIADNWNYYIGGPSKELEYYTDSIGNVFQRNGKLHLCATKDPREGKICSSGRISSLGKKEFLYGRIEVRAKVPTGKGIFPAIWLLRTDHPKVVPFGEIDMMEYIECFEKKQFCTTIHIVERQPGQDEIRHKHSNKPMCDMSKYHIYGLEWYPDRLVFFLDRKEYFRLEKKDAEFWPFDAPYYLILDVAMGSWGAKCGVDENILPKEMLIDWIKYYPLL